MAGALELVFHLESAMEQDSLSARKLEWVPFQLEEREMQTGLSSMGQRGLLVRAKA